MTRWRFTEEIPATEEWVCYVHADTEQEALDKFENDDIDEEKHLVQTHYGDAAVYRWEKDDTNPDGHVMPYLDFLAEKLDEAMNDVE